MKEIIAEAIIRDGKIKYINRKLPAGEIKVRMIYNIDEDESEISHIETVVRETAGIYKSIDPAKESSDLRSEWDRSEK